MSESASGQKATFPSTSVAGSGEATSTKMPRPSNATVLPATVAHAVYIGENLRAQDKEELRALSPEDSFPDIMVASHTISYPLCFTVIWERKPVAMFGVAPTPTKETGSVWMLGTDGLLAAGRYLNRYTRQWVEWMNSIYPTLVNECAASNSVSIAWLKHTGFEFGLPHNRHGISFIPFWRTPPPCASLSQSSQE